MKLMKDIVSKGRIWGKPIDQMDVWLDTQGYYRKHTARDGTCLFRAVSEQLFLTQVFHPEVRRQIVDYQLRHADFFQRMVNCPLEIYADKMRNSREWGGKIEIIAMAMFYRHDFEMFLEIGKPPELITHFNFGKVISLCYSQDRHYDSVYAKDNIATTAFCQSVVYEVLYKRVFDLKEVDYAVKKMLHDKTSRYQREHFPFLGAGFALRLEMRDTYLNVKDLLDYGITPFPYKVARCLDCEVYRNVEYDTWNEYRKGLRYGFCAWSCRELQVGVKCLVKIDEQTSHHGHIQEMKPNKGPVVVFIVELGEMMTVPYDSLEMLPQSAPTYPMKPPVRVFPIKLPPIIQDEEGNEAKWILKAVPVRPKLKELNNFSNKQEVVNKEPSKETQNPTVSSMQRWKTVFVTGGAGYIGSHCIVVLLEAGYNVVAVDNFSNSVCGNGEAVSLKRVEAITGKKVHFYQCDLLEKDKLADIFQKYQIDCVIHFAAIKAVGESMQHPFMYYKNNIIGTINLLEVMEKANCHQLVFSSSCTVYGNPEYLPITESHPTGNITNVYGRTKYFIEEMLKDVSMANTKWNIILLRYFNPVGAHPSGMIGEDPTKAFTNLMPYIAQVANGDKEILTIFGGDYDTPDGTGIRDYIHVMDLATGHVAALKKLQHEKVRIKIYNLGTGQGYSVLQLIRTFEAVTKTKVPYKIEDRRQGDIVSIFANAGLAKEELNWETQYSVEEMCEHFWKWKTMNPKGYLPDVYNAQQTNGISNSAFSQNGHQSLVQV